MNAVALAVAVRSVSRSHVGRVRQINEDRIFDHPDAGIWAIADGMGGHSGGDLAAQQVVDCLRVAGAASPTGVREALHTAHRLIGERNRRLRLDAGATAVAAVLDGDMLEIAWAGDSRAYRLSGGTAEQLTRDHSLVQQLVDAGLLEAAAAEQHPHAHIVTRALGVSGELALDTIRVPAAGRFMLCSDGLSRSLDARDIAADLPLSALADRLVTNAVERDGSDNVSLVLIDIG